ncbi:MAG: sugar phosphate isomerase/epimerase [Acidobacteriota bacterium]|nr:sugar phosphate isomerase/epimerase [Acidobacteriota bacterium]
MKKSIGDSIFPHTLTFGQGLQLLKRADYQGIELWLGERPWFQMETTDTQLRQLFSQIRDAGLEVSNISNTLDWDQNICARDPAKRRAALHHVERQIEAAQIFKTDAILVVAGVVTADMPYNEVYARCVESSQKLGEVARNAKVKIGLENCNSEQKFLLSPREFHTFLDDVNNPWVGIHLDVGNIHDTGFAEQWIEIHGPRITRIHVKDVMKHRGRCGQESVYTNLFLGDNDWRAIRNAMTKVNYDGWIIAEMEARYRYAADQQVFDTSAAMTRLITGQL